MKKKCKNLDCENNVNGFCSKESSKTTTYDKIMLLQWKKIRKYMEEKKNRGLKANRKCKNIQCINNIKGECYLLTELEVLNNIL